jgi:mRNA interferase HigB
MRIISRRAIKTYWEGYRSADQSALESALKAWYQEAKKARWKTAAEVKAKYRRASILKKGRVVFNISGNKFRLVAWINYSVGVLYIRWVGTHAEYDKINAEEV